jgi:hypothetical protein
MIEEDKKVTSMKARQQELRIWFKKLKKSSKCFCCPENCKVCLEFHHKYGKDYSVSQMVNNGYCSKNHVLAEIKKCVVVCANCHRKIHSGIIKLEVEHEPQLA